MNKQDLINSVAETTGFLKANAKAAVEATLQHISAALVSDGEAAFVGFGTFKVEQREARVGRNPATGEPLNIAAKKVVKFKAASAVAEAINQ